MRHKTLPPTLTFLRVMLVLITICITSIGLPHALAQTESVLYSFQGGFVRSIDGADPSGGLTWDAHGNLLGATFSGDPLFAGTVFELSPAAGGGWSETLLHSLTGGKDGDFAEGKVVLDADGNVYGVAYQGGGNPPGGTVFRISPANGGGWTTRIIYTFTQGADGGLPLGGLTIDAAGNLYGAAEIGGNPNFCIAIGGCGVVFKLSPTSNGPWKETVLHAFTGGKDGGLPQGGLVLDSAGNLYGTTSFGGNLGACITQFSSGCGIVFKLSPTLSAGWQETVIHAFTGGRDGSSPYGYLSLDAAGSVYGTTSQGGRIQACGGVGCGVAFEFSPGSVGWKGTLLHTFTGGVDGASPIDGLVLVAGNLFGQTSAGGNLSDCQGSGCGVVYRLSHISARWQQTTLYSFTGGDDGSNPSSGLILDGSGNLYGETAAGGTLGKGVVFQLVP